MKFTFDDDQESIRELADGILAKRCSFDQVKQPGSGAGELAWKDFAQSGLLGLPLPEDVGGAGTGIFEAAIVLEQIGRYTAPLPYLSSVVGAALPIARFGSDAQLTAWLPDTISGATVLTAALVEPGSRPTEPRTTATEEAGGWLLNGCKMLVTGGADAAAVLVPAAVTGGGVGVFIVPCGAAGVSWQPEESTLESPTWTLRLNGVHVGEDALLGGRQDGSGVLRSIVENTTVGICAIVAGLSATAVDLIADYSGRRSQFGRPIGAFQAVSQRAGDAAIDLEAVRLTTWLAASALSRNLPAARRVAVAKFWAAEGGQRIVHAAQHLHGGMGVDRDYPLHRCFLWAKHYELLLGGAPEQLRWLGADLVANGIHE